MAPTVDGGNGDVTSLHSLYMLVGELKRVRRTGWLLSKVGQKEETRDDPSCNPNSQNSVDDLIGSGVDCVESVGDHMYRMSIMALTLPLGQYEDSANLDRDRVVKLTIVHDIAEAVVGDLIVGRDSLTKDTKHKLESDAILKMKSMLESANSNETADSLHSLWLEYETQSSQEAKLAKDLDRYDMILQALEYEMRDNAPRKLQSFFDSTEGCFKFACVKNLVQVLYDKRKQFQELFAQQ